MRGTDASTGLAIEGDAYRRQTVAKILFTPIGTRVMRRDFGSLLPELIDRPYGPALRQQLYAATAVALMRWARWMRLRQVTITPVTGEPGAFDLDLTYEDSQGPAPSALSRLSLPLRRQSGAAGLSA